MSFAQQFLDVMILVAWKIRDKGWWMLNSVAEELAMRAILEGAEVQAELEGKTFTSCKKLIGSGVHPTCSARVRLR